MEHIHNPYLKYLKTYNSFNLSPPLSTRIGVDLTSDINKGFTKTVYCMSWKEQVFLMFCGLSVAHMVQSDEANHHITQWFITKNLPREGHPPILTD